MATMMNTRNFSKMFAEALGIPTERLMRFDIHVEPNNIVRVNAVYSADIKDGELQEVLKQYEVRERGSS